METPYEIVGKYLSNEASQSEVDELMEWRKASPDNEQEYLLLLSSWGHSFNDISQYEAQKEEVFQETLAMIGQGNKSRSMNIVWASIAAAVLIGIGLVFYSNPGNVSDVELVSASTGEEIKQVNLPDGSIVWLNTGSRLTYTPNFVGEERVVSLTGEAYFDVARDEKKPFVIHAGASKTRVLGTAFNLNAKRVEEVRLTVTEGKVKFSNQEESILEIVKVGEEALLSVTETRIQKNTMTDQNAMAWKTGVLKFVNYSLKDMAESLSNYYQVPFFVAEGLENVPVTFTIYQYSLEETLDIINNIGDFKIAKKDKTYHITEQ